MAVFGFSCHKDPLTRTEQEWWRLEQRKIDLQRQIEISKMHFNCVELAKARSTEIHSHVDNLATRRATLVANRAYLELAVINLEQNLSTIRNNSSQMTARMAAGQKFETLTTPAGKRYENVTVVRISDAGLDIRHSTGSARLGYSDLSPEMRRAFGLDPDRAQIALERESLASAQYERQINRDLIQQALSTPKNIVRNTPVQDAATTNPLDEPGRTVASPMTAYYGYYGNYGYYRNYHTRYYTRYYVPLPVKRHSTTSTEKSSPSENSP